MGDLAFNGWIHWRDDSGRWRSLPASEGIGSGTRGVFVSAYESEMLDEIERLRLRLNVTEDGA